MSVLKSVPVSLIPVFSLVLLLPIGASNAWAQNEPSSTAEPAADTMPAPSAGTAPPGTETTASPGGMPLEGPDGLPQLPPRSAFDPILQRPLFNSSRRPDLNENSTPASEGDLRDNWRLTGVVRVDQKPLALFSEVNGDRQMRLNVGMPLDSNWTVSAIHQHSVVLSYGEQEVEMELFVPRPVPATPDTSATSESDQTQSATPTDKVPASIEARTRTAVQKLRERVDAAKGGTQ